jgi:hypothetical protein
LITAVLKFRNTKKFRYGIPAYDVLAHLEHCIYLIIFYSLIFYVQ